MTPVRSVAVPPFALGVLTADNGLDQSEVAVASLVEDLDAFRLGIDVDEELVAELLHPGDGVLFEHRLDREAFRLHDPALGSALRRAVGDLAEEDLLLVGAGPDPRLLEVVDGAALELVDDLVDPGPMGLGRRMGPQRSAIDHERDLDDVRDGGTPMLLDRELDESVAPIVENALRHGLKDGHGWLRVEVRRVGNQLHYDVSDDGIGLPGKPLERGTGLSNISRRLELLFPHSHALTFGSREPRGAVVSLSFPVSA